VYRKTAPQFQSDDGRTAAKITVAEVEHLVAGRRNRSDHIHTRGRVRKRIVEVGTSKKTHRATHHAQARRRRGRGATGVEV